MMVVLLFLVAFSPSASSDPSSQLPMAWSLSVVTTTRSIGTREEEKARVRASGAGRDLMR